VVVSELSRQDKTYKAGCNLSASLFVGLAEADPEDVVDGWMVLELCVASTLAREPVLYWHLFSLGARFMIEPLLLLPVSKFYLSPAYQRKREI
jgi:hypothetical protein